MSKKSSSTRNAKMRRQAKALAVRREGQVATNWQATVDAFYQAIAKGLFRMVCPDGQVRDLTLERMSAHIEADMVSQGVEPFASPETFLPYAYDDLEFGTLWLRPDGLWQSREDYFTDRPVTA